ncbi:RDD family protein [Marinimicrobium agarilyticum]|uniref:RDD family protein n=1 Tax=Marinimicrobium agarilyticum TaxID=306546 RepID=UPI00040CEECE|nr:RDD family protein [Marinimicrobium agarilyticum]
MNNDVTPNLSSSTASSLKGAGLWRRFAAMVYDSLLLMALALGYGALATFLNVMIQGAPPEGEAIRWGAWRLPVFLGLLGVWVGFFYYFWGKHGQTLGMRAWRLKLVDARSGGPATREQRLGRALLAIPALLLAGTGYFWRWADPAGHTLHGRFSKTRIILLPKEKR